MYTSGRTVKSPAARPTTVASATADARRLVRKHMAGVQNVTVSSTRTADMETMADQVRTVITYPAGSDGAAELVEAITLLPGVGSMRGDGCSITFVRNV